VARSAFRRDDVLVASQAELDPIIEQVWRISHVLRKARVATARHEYVDALRVAHGLVEELAEIVAERRDLDAGYGIGPELDDDEDDLDDDGRSELIDD